MNKHNNKCHASSNKCLTSSNKKLSHSPKDSLKTRLEFACSPRAMHSALFVGSKA